MARKKSDDDSWSDDNAFSDDDDEDEEEEKMKFVPITCGGSTGSNIVFDSLSDAIKYDLEKQQFDLLSFLPSSSDEEFFEKSIIVVNKCRDYVLKRSNGDSDDANIGKELTEYLLHSQQTKSNNDDDDEQFFKPVLADDAILMSMDDLEALQEEKEQGGDRDGTEPQSADSFSSKSDLALRIAALEQQLAAAKTCIASLTNEEDTTKATPAAPLVAKPSPPKKRDNDTYYFTGYSHHSIHETMLKDFVRTSSYEKAILSNTDTLFKDKIVLDIGCGTGVLSLFAAKAGARKVIAIDNSDIIAEATKIIELNGYGDVITCVRGKVEDLLAEGGKSRLPLDDDEKVDVIVSEWMGYALLFETMLPSVMAARDTIMNKNTGTMYPNGSNVLLEGATDDALDYWDNVHGINMTPMKSRVVRDLTTEASVEIVDPMKVVTNRVELIYFDLNTCKDQDLDFEASFQLEPKIAAEEEKGSVHINKLVVSFDIDFNVPDTNALSFSTGCQSQATHWKQTTLWFDPTNGIPTLQKGDVLRGKFKMGRNEDNHREMDFLVMWEVGHHANNSNEFVRILDGVIKSKLTA
mmetsp:Transcript_9400/g.13360  ORF Transcript_9400/g.13360 Transcript_9400/m.13360 type:complete len:578 (+) Transcript_9400:93-1826(+)